MSAQIPSFALEWPVKVVFGLEEIEKVGAEASRWGDNAFLVTDAEVARLGVADLVRCSLEAAAIAVTVFEGAAPNPTCRAIDEAAVAARQAGCNLVVGVGGGSALDLAKGIAVAATHPGSVWQYVTYTGAQALAVTQATLPIITVPTTAGSGAEVSRYVVLDNPTIHWKAPIHSAYTCPRVAVIDPTLMTSMSSRLTAISGIDAVAHGIESFLNVTRRTPMSDLLAVEAVRVASRALPQCVAQGDDLAARSEMAWASVLGGMAINMAGTTVAHAMAQPLGARTGAGHGLTVALLLPVVLARSWMSEPQRYAALARAMGAKDDGMTEAVLAQLCAQVLRDLTLRIGLQPGWRQVGADHSLVDQLVDDVLTYMARPLTQHRPVLGRDEVRQIFEEAW